MKETFNRLYNKIDKKFIRFLFVGVLNTLFGYSIYALFIFIGLHYSLAVFFSTILGILFNFKTIGILVFKNNDNSLIFRFFGVYAINYILNVSALTLLKFSGSDNMYINGLIVVFPLALLSFILNKKFVFVKRKE